jgi:outer membrane receptor protein involved in Fe transport
VRYGVVTGAYGTASFESVQAIEGGVRSELGAAQALGDGYPRVVVEVLRVDERSIGAWLGGEFHLSDTLRVNAGIRRDLYRFDVEALQPANSGEVEAGLTSRKAGLAWHVAAPLELYANWGEGFHSNDARGATLHIDPVTGEPADPVTPLVPSQGSEIGLRWAEAKRFQTTLALWQLDLDSELLFVGDAGNTEATRPSERKGAELTAYWFAHPKLNLELEVAYTDARFSDQAPEGQRIPGAVPWVASLGWNADWANGWSSNLRWRYLSPAPLTENGSVMSAGSTLVNLAIGKQWQRWRVELDVLNLLDSDGHDIDYFYASRLPGEPEAGIEDIHYHVFEPRTLRLRVTFDL